MMQALQNSLKNRFFEEAATTQGDSMPENREKQDKASVAGIASLVEDAVKRYCEENLPRMIREQLAQMELSEQKEESSNQLLVEEPKPDEPEVENSK